MADQQLTFDVFGFAILPSASGKLRECDDERCHAYSTPTTVTRNTQTAWKRVLANWERYRVGARQEKVRKLIIKGMDPSIRGEFWRKTLDISRLESSVSFSYEGHVQQLRQEMVTLGVTEYNIDRTEHFLSNMSPEEQVPSHLNIVAIRQILLDVGRSYPTHRNFFPRTADGVEGQAALFRVLAVYTIYNPEINYCQGMSYLAGILMMQLEEKETFWALVSLMERRKYLSGYYNTRLERIQGLGKVFKKVLEKKLPELSKHLESLQIDPLTYLPKWILSLFTNLPCWDSVLLVWDLLLLDGSIVIFQTSLAIMMLAMPDILRLDDVNLVIPFLQRLTHKIVNRGILAPAIEEIRFEGWEVHCIQTLVHEEATRCPCCGRGATTCRCRQRKVRNSGSVFRKVFRALTRQDKVAPSPAMKVSESDSSFEVFHTGNSPASEMGRTPKSRQGKGIRKLIGSSASLQLAFRQFQVSNCRRTSNLHKMVDGNGNDCSPMPSPNILDRIDPNVTVRRPRKLPELRVLPCDTPPSPVELMQMHSDLKDESVSRPSTPSMKPKSQLNVPKSETPKHPSITEKFEESDTCTMPVKVPRSKKHLNVPNSETPKHLSAAKESKESENVVIKVPGTKMRLRSVSNSHHSSTPKLSEESDKMPLKVPRSKKRLSVPNLLTHNHFAIPEELEKVQGSKKDPTVSNGQTPKHSSTAKKSEESENVLPTEPISKKKKKRKSFSPSPRALLMKARKPLQRLNLSR